MKPTPPALDSKHTRWGAWLPRGFANELSQGVRTRGFVFWLGGLHTVITVAFIVALAMNIFSRRDATVLADGAFWFGVIVTLCVVTPLRALGGVRREAATGEAGGRCDTWASLVAQAALIVFTMLPYEVIRYFLGTATLRGDLGGLAFLFALCGAGTAVMLWISKLRGGLRVAVALGLGLVLIAPAALVVVATLAYAMGEWAPEQSDRIGFILQIFLLVDLAVLLVYFFTRQTKKAEASK